MGGTYPTPRQAAQAGSRALGLGFPSGALGGLPPLPKMPKFPGGLGNILRLGGGAIPGIGTGLLLGQAGYLVYQYYHQGTGAWEHPRYYVVLDCSRTEARYLSGAAPATCAINSLNSTSTFPPPGTINVSQFVSQTNLTFVAGQGNVYRPSKVYLRSTSGTSGSWSQDVDVKRVGALPMRSVSTSRDPLTGRFPWQGALPLPHPVSAATARGDRAGLAQPGEWSHGGYYPPWVLGGAWVPGMPGLPWDPAIPIPKPFPKPGVISPPVVVPRPDKPAIPTVPSTRFVVTSRSRTAARPTTYRPGKPGKKTKELKLWARKNWQAVARLVNAPTEACDFINAMHKSLTASDTKGFTRSKGLAAPSLHGVRLEARSDLALGMRVDRQMQRKLFERRGYRAATCTDKLIELYDYAGHINVSVFMENLLINQVTDFIFGKIGSIGGKASARQGARSGRLAGIETGPLH